MSFLIHNVRAVWHSCEARPDFEEAVAPEDKIARANFEKLMTRRKGERFYVDENGCLQRTWRHLSKDDKKRVQEVVSNALHHVKLDNHDAMKKVFFSSPLTRMERSVYNRGVIEEGSDLEKLLWQSRAERSRALQAALTEENREKIEKELIALALDEFKFAQKLGIDLERNGDGGSGGARYARDRYGKKLLVVKPGDEGPHGVNNPQWYARFKRLFVSPRACLRGNSEPQAEVDSYIFDRKMGINIVPPTELAHIKSLQFKGQHTKECSVQMFVAGCTTLGEHLGVAPWRHNVPRGMLRSFCSKMELPPGLAERLAVHNLGIEDIDCHFENVLVMKVEEDTPDLRGFDVAKFFAESKHQTLLQALLYREAGICLIKHDGGSSGPHHHPTGVLETKFKHLFEVLPAFDQTFQREWSNDAAFATFLEEKAFREVRNILEKGLYKRYKVAGETNLRHWLFNDKKLQDAVVQDLMAVCTIPLGKKAAFRAYFHYHLERIYRNKETRIESWRIIQKYTPSDKSMREALQVVTERDFKRELVDAPDVRIQPPSGASALDESILG